jgi:hypothetical protein
MGRNVKWSFLLGLTAAGTIATVALSGLIAGRNATSCLQLFAQESHSLSLLVLIVAAWAGLINDAAAASGVSRILGYEVQFKEITMYDEFGTEITPLRSKLYVVYPIAILFGVTLLAIATARM